MSIIYELNTLLNEVYEEEMNSKLIYESKFEKLKQGAKDGSIYAKYYGPIYNELDKAGSHDSHNCHHFLLIIDNKKYDNYYIITVDNIEGLDESKKYLRKNIKINNGKLIIINESQRINNNLVLTFLFNNKKFENIPKIENSGISNDSIDGFKKIFNKYENVTIRLNAEKRNQYNI